MVSMQGAVIHGLDHIEIYVWDSYQAAHFYRSAFGFDVVEVGRGADPTKEQSSLLLRNADVRLLLTAPLSATSPVAEYLRSHGEGVRDIAFVVSGIEQIYERATRCGARPLSGPAGKEAGRGSHLTACVGVFGDVVHTLVERMPRDNGNAPATVATNPLAGSSAAAINGVDHLAMALEAGQMDRWVSFYEEVFSFRQTHSEYVNTDYSAMRSKVVESVDGSVKFPLVEPANGESQVARFIESHQGPGVQHLALLSNDIIASVSALKRAGAEFLTIPDQYYRGLEDRIGAIPELETFRELGILLDRDPSGLLLQIFTKPVWIRPTFFLELIERRGSVGFGSGNIKALYEAIEQSMT